MNILENFRDYRKHLPDFETWKQEQDLARAKRVHYLKQNPQLVKPEDIQRGKSLLHAIDIMDEYSQSNAEDMEVAAELAASQIVTIANSIGFAIGTLITYTKPIQKWLKSLEHNKTLKLFATYIPSFIGIVTGTIASFPAIAMSIKAKVSASRRGRFEAMDKELNNPAIFAVLNTEQEKQVEKLSKTVELDKKDLKRLDKLKGKKLAPTETITTIKNLYTNEKNYKIRKKEFEEKLKENESKFDTQLNDKQIINAKRDQQILANMVHRIDIASQDYAENAELATNTITGLSLGSGALIGWISDKILKAFNASSKITTKTIPWFIGASIPLIVNLYATKIQKQASRIGRFNIKQEMMKNPEEFVYVDEKDYESINIDATKEKKKINIFKFLKQFYADNKKYQEYLKTEGINNIKKHKAINKINLTEQQLKDAKALQTNVFKTFNKVDEKSQTYSENVEGVGSLAKQAFTILGTIGITVYSIISLSKMKQLTKQQMYEKLSKLITPYVFLVLPLIGIDIITTKEQKKASRVADMLALNDLKDYRHYADYSEKKSPNMQKLQNSTETNLIKRSIG